MGKERVFKFKKFDVAHSRSALKVGVDGVLIALWCGSGCDFNPRRVLDVGCGCGVMSLICAQRFSEAMVSGIDVDLPSVEEASSNFMSSPWPDRLSAYLRSFDDLVANCPPGEKYDLIVSNPPFFNAGVTPVSSREIARHGDQLSPSVLVRECAGLLSSHGRLSLIAPADAEDQLIDKGLANGLHPIRVCRVKGHSAAPVKRVMIEFSRCPVADPDVYLLILETSPGIPTPEYHALGHEFYYKW